jgi:glycosyltransferase involved in cell wall biosynthesis
MAAGVATVATRHGSFPSLVTDGADGLLVAPGDAGALTAALASLIGDPALADALGRRGRQSYLERFTPVANLRLIEAIYARAVATREPGAAVVP